MQVNPWGVGIHDVLTGLRPLCIKTLNAADKVGMPDSIENTD